MPPERRAGHTVVLVRHASSQVPTADGPDDLRRPLTDADLSAARDLAPELAALQPKRILSSPYLRAVQTVAPAAEMLQLAVTLDDGLREWWAASAPAPPCAFHDRALRAWRQPESAVADGESIADLDVRVVRGLRRLQLLARQDGTVMAAGHGTWIARALAASDDRVDIAFWMAMPTPAVYVIRWDGHHRAPVVSGPGL